MAGFSADWLALREPADALVRSAALVSVIVEHLADVDPLRVLDLGAGTGANARYLDQRFPRGARWLLVDDDPDLLARAACAIPADRLDTRIADLATALDPPDDDIDIISGHDLVTASALLDLVSAEWLLALAGRCRDAEAAVLFALTYNGTMECTPREPEDELVRDLVNVHQRTDKGFGPALGPDAAETAARAFDEVGYEVWREPSDWALSPDSTELQTQLIEGWAEAAEAVSPERAAAFRDWKRRRLAHVAAGRSRVVVGHEDLAAWPI
jgi:SAM-dependent methyltransferase